MRIAFLVRAFPTVSETFIRDQVQGLRRRGHSVEVYSLYVGSRPPSKSDTPAHGDSGVAAYLLGRELSLSGALLRAARRSVSALRHPMRLLHLASVGLQHPRIAAEAVHAVPILAPRSRAQERSYDVVHAHYGPTGMLGLALRRAGLLSGPLVTTFHGVDLSRYPFRRGTDCYSWLFTAGEAFTVNSEFAERRALALGAPADRLDRLPVGVPIHRIPFKTRQPPDDGPVRLLSVGRLEEVKGFSFGLRAAHLLLEGGIDVRYTIVGSGRLESALRSEAAHLGVRSAIDFAGSLPFDAVVREYARHHLFLMPGIQTPDGQAETQGRVLLEAQAAGLPVIASRVGGIPETVGPSAGLLVPPGDPSALADAVVRLLDRPGEWQTMGRSGRSHVEMAYDQEKLLDRLMGIYRRVARDGLGGRAES